MASQQNSLTQSIYSLGSQEPDITNMGLMTQHTEHTSIKRKHKHVWVQTCEKEEGYRARLYTRRSQGYKIVAKVTS